LIISWEPNGAISAPNETALFTKIFDLSSEEQEFEFEIPYKALYPWLDTDTDPGITTASPHYGALWSNGTFSLAILNPLTAPVATAPVTILISAAASEDMEFAAPRALDQFVTTAMVQSGPVDGSAISCSDHLAEITVGERVASLRPLLHRVSLSCSQFFGGSIPSNATVSSGDWHAVNMYHKYPETAGYNNYTVMNYALSTLNGTAKTPFNYVHHHPINWVCAAFAGYRGSFVVHANVQPSGTRGGIGGLSITRVAHNWIPTNSTNNTVNNASATQYNPNDGSAKLGKSTMNILAGTLGSVHNVEYTPSGFGGMTLTNGRTQMSCSAVIPQYIPVRFTPAWPDQRDSLTAATYTGIDNIRVDGDFDIDQAVANPSRWPRLDMYWAAGVDFTTIFFTGVPRMYKYTWPDPITLNF
jgi:hypothetical protein